MVKAMEIKSNIATTDNDGVAAVAAVAAVESYVRYLLLLLYDTNCAGIRVCVVVSMHTRIKMLFTNSAPRGSHDDAHSPASLE